MSVRFLMCLIACFWESTASSVILNEIAPGSDVSYSCLSGEASWTGPRLDSTVRVKINRTEYLLIKNFQKQNEAVYICGSEKVKLELKPASSKDKLVLFRASERDSLFLFCKTTLNLFKATWSWRPHNSNTIDKYINLGLDSTHFGNRLQIRNNNNDFSASISPVDWSDSGKYKCELSGRLTVSTVFEVVVVRVHADPQHPNNGDDVILKCEVSNQTQDIKLYWINRKTQENFPNPHQLRNVTTRMNWACAVFNSSTLNALIPLTLTISQPSEISQPISLIGICTVFIFILIVLIGAVCWRKKFKSDASPKCDSVYDLLRAEDEDVYTTVIFEEVFK